jgi:TniQ
MERYEEWDLSIPPIPPRSRLYRLEPIGIGTPYVESLTSYVTRLAETHCVTPKNLIMREIMPSLFQTEPILKYYSRVNKLWSERPAVLNGISPIARQWVEMLQSLTLSDNLRFLTMLMFNKVIAISRLLRRSKAWCSLCYEEWRLTHKEIYDPLLWSLNGVDICSRHRQPLVTRCLHCQKTIPFLTQKSRPGYCPRCTRWLGNIKESLSIVDKEVSEFQYWVAEVSGDLIATAPNLAVPPPRKQVALRIEAFLDHHADGNISKLSRLLGVTIKSLWGYLREEQVPYFDSFLKICFALSITPLEFLSTTTIPPLKNMRFNLESIPHVSRGKGKHVSEDDVRCMRQVLETVLAVDNQFDLFPNLKEIAKRMGFSEWTVRKHCPDLSKAIARRYMNHWGEEEDLMRMKQVLEKELTNSEPKPLANAARQLHCWVDTLRRYFPDLCHRIVKRYSERFDDALIEQRLQDVLARKEDTPAVSELAREMGYDPRILRRKFPELCNQVSTRHSAEQRKRRAEQNAETCHKIRSAVFLLHEQGIYPSTRQVRILLSDRHIILMKVGYEAWRSAIEELDYSAHRPKSRLTSKKPDDVSWSSSP